MEIFSLNINISKVWQHYVLKLCKLCKQEVHILNRSTCKTPCHARTPSTGISLTDRAHGVQHSVEGTAMAGGCAQIKILSSWFNLPFPTHDYKTSFLEKLYRERLQSYKANQNVFFQPIVPSQKREGIISSGGTWYTTFISHKFIKLPVTYVGKSRTPSCTLYALW